MFAPWLSFAIPKNKIQLVIAAEQRMRPLWKLCKAWDHYKPPATQMTNRSQVKRAAVSCRTLSVLMEQKTSWGDLDLRLVCGCLAQRADSLTFVLWLCHWFCMILVYCRVESTIIPTCHGKKPMTDLSKVAVGFLHPASWSARLITRLAGSRFPMTNVPGPTKLPRCLLKLPYIIRYPTNQTNSGLKPSDMPTLV